MTEILKPSKVPSNEYAITITLSRKMRDRNDIAEDQYDALLERINEWSDKCNLRLSLITEFTKDYRIHFHGFIRHENINLLNNTYRNNICRYFNESVRKYDIGFICVKSINNEDTWHAYCTKEVLSTDKALHRNIVAKDNLLKFTQVAFDLRFQRDNLSKSA